MKSNEAHPPKSADPDHDQDDARLADLQAENQALKIQLERQRQLTEKRYAQLRAAELAQQDLQDNFSWKILEQLRVLRLRLAPIGTRRDRVLDSWLDFALVARKQGLRRAVQLRRAGADLEIVQNEVQSTTQAQAYQRWLNENRVDEAEQDRQRQAAGELAATPQFCVLFMGGDAAEIQVSLDSLQAQTYAIWSAILIQPDSGAAEQNEQVAYAGTLATALEQTDAEFVGLFEPGDRFAVEALYRAAVGFNASPESRIIYSDEDLQIDGVRQRPWFKPDWSPDLLLSVNFLNGAWFRRADIQSAALPESEDPHLLSWLIGLQLNPPPAQALHLPAVLIQRSAARPKRPLADAAAAGLVAHLHHQGLSAELGDHAESAQLTWPTRGRKVSIIIPTRENVDTVRKCLDSIFGLTDYPDFEVILVDNDSQATETRDYYETLQTETRIRIVDYPQIFNYQGANNLGVAAATGELLLFLNNDTEILDAGWLDELVRWVDRPDVGVVGAKLLFPDGSLQHAGVILGMVGHAHHVFWGGPEDQQGPFGSPNWYRNYSAVTGACMMIARATFDQVGGFDEQLSIGFGDLDLCLRVGDLGQRIVYTPFARLLHHEGKSRGSHVPFSDMLEGLERVVPRLERGDPYYNPNLSYLTTTPIPRPANEPRPADNLLNVMYMIRGGRTRDLRKVRFRQQ